MKIEAKNGNLMKGILLAIGALLAGGGGATLLKPTNQEILKEIKSDVKAIRKKIDSNGMRITRLEVTLESLRDRIQRLEKK